MFRLLAGERTGLDSSALDLAAHDVDRVLRHDNEVLGDLVDLLDETSKLLGRLDEHLLLRLTVLSHVGLPSRGVCEIVEVDGLVLGHGQLTCLQEGRRIRKAGRLGLRSGGRGGRHFCREEGDDIFESLRSSTFPPRF